MSPRGRRHLLAVLLAAVPMLALAAGEGTAPQRSPRPQAAPERAADTATDTAADTAAPAVVPSRPTASLVFPGPRPVTPAPSPAASPEPVAAPPAQPLAFTGVRPRARPPGADAKDPSPGAAPGAPPQRASIAAGIRPGAGSLAAFPVAPARPEAEAAPTPDGGAPEAGIGAGIGGGATIPFRSPRPEGRPAHRPESPTEVVTPTAMPPGRAVERGPGGFVCGVTSIRGVPIADKVEPVKGCGLSDGVRVTSVSGIALSLPAEIDCQTARTLDTWVERAVKPAVGRMGGGLARLEIAGSYTCRPRNNQPGAKVSEHGRGKAVDVSGLTLADGRVLSVSADWRAPEAGKVLRRIHDAACGPFGTVLGPGSDGFHEDHIHLDTAPRARSAYCR
ncbi:extensin family protein [Frigidibacter sp. MR17.24]|uniref:extensin family protein n=1 Tax=Frigidibacter sp. MR17.24 TaxID=3127345 RepID=UPI003012BF4B